MVDIIKLAVVLTAVTLVAGFAIALTNSRTADRIVMQQKAAEQEALMSVFPEGVTIEEKKASAPLPSRYWEATKGSELVGYAFQDSSRGFEKDIKIIVGVSPSGIILGMNILSQSETPGLGTRVQEVASKKYLWNALSKQQEETKAWFTEQFAGLQAGKDITIDKSAEWHTLSSDAKKKLLESNSVSAITGATISTRAVIAAATTNIPGYVSHLSATQESTNAE